MDLCCALEGFSGREKGQRPPWLTVRPAPSGHRAARQPGMQTNVPEPKVTRATRYECALGQTTDCTSHRGSQNLSRWLSRRDMMQMWLRGHPGVFLIACGETSNLRRSVFQHPLEAWCTGGNMDLGDPWSPEAALWLGSP